MNISGRMSNQLAASMASTDQQRDPSDHINQSLSKTLESSRCAQAECPRPMAVQQSVSSPANNPYTTFNICCTVLNTKEHAQFVGIVSFSLFICLVVISLLMFGFLSVFFIAFGAIVYGMLMKVLFGGYHDKFYVLVYLLFEALQIGFYFALFLYVFIPFLFGQMFIDDDETITVEAPKFDDASKTDNEKISRAVLGQMTVIVLLLMSVKVYFAHVITKFYKHMAWEENNRDGGRQFRAQYFNRREVQISIGDTFAPAHALWDADGNDVVTNGQLYSYTFAHQTENRPFPELPTYLQVMGGHEKVQPSSSSPPLQNNNQTTSSAAGGISEVTTNAEERQ